MGLRYCFVCMNPIREQKALPPDQTTVDGSNPNDNTGYIEVYVNRGFCHSSYWERKGKRYGRVKNARFGWLFVCRKCDEGEAYSSPIGEGYTTCDNCGATFSNDDFNSKVFMETGEGDTLCPNCVYDLENAPPERPTPEFNWLKDAKSLIPWVLIDPTDVFLPSRIVSDPKITERSNAIVQMNNAWLEWLNPMGPSAKDAGLA